MVVTFQPVPIASAPDCVATSMSMEMWPWGGEMTGHYRFVSWLSLSCWVCRARKSDQIMWAWGSLGWLSACKVYIATIVGRRTLIPKSSQTMYIHTLKLVNICDSPSPYYLFCIGFLDSHVESIDSEHSREHLIPWLQIATTWREIWRRNQLKSHRFDRQGEGLERLEK